MAWRCAFNCRVINTYQQALERWERTKPWRGEEKSNSRPLGATRNRNYSLIKEEDYVACELYRTKCVVFYKDGKIKLNSNGWSTITTADFINAVSPYSINRFRGKLYVSPDHINHYYIADSITLENGVPIAFHQETEEVLNKEIARVIHKKIAGFRKYVKTVYAINKNQSLRFSGAKTERNEQALDELKNLCYGATISVDNYAYLLQSMVLFIGEYNSYDSLIRWFRNILYDINGAYKQIEAPIGKIPSANRYCHPHNVFL